MKLSDRLKQTEGRITVQIYRSGRLYKTITEHNMIVDAGKKRMADLIAGKSTAAIKYIGLGSGEAAAATSDINLQDQQLYPLTQASITGTTARFDFFITTNQANGLTIHEFGLFCADEVMFSHRVREGKIVKENDMELRGYWKIEI